MKDTLTDDAVAVHVDYSENYSCKYAKEIKDTHFGTGNDQLASTKPGVIDTREVSCFCGRNCQCFYTNCHVFSEEGDEDPDRTEATIEVGQWVLVEYNDVDMFTGTVNR
ncbi:hypothetical protein QQF64_036407 [Cirrhinus molitorella]|uniref:Uncharacterized protein n=1 Tax=Cirrhinus molitorella TaxID=172907 RepID=A0ABR3NIP8_9TELE